MKEERKQPMSSGTLDNSRRNDVHLVGTRPQEIHQTAANLPYAIPNHAVFAKCSNVMIGGKAL